MRAAHFSTEIFHCINDIPEQTKAMILSSHINIQLTWVYTDNIREQIVPLARFTTKAFISTEKSR